MEGLTPITPFEELVDHTEVTGVPWWRQRLFTAKGWTYHIDTIGVAPLSGEVTE